MQSIEDISRIIALILTLATSVTCFWLVRGIFAANAALRMPPPTPLVDTVNVARIALIASGAVLTVVMLWNIFAVVRLSTPQNTALNLWIYDATQLAVFCVSAVAAWKLQQWRNRNAALHPPHSDTPQL